MDTWSLLILKKLYLEADFWVEEHRIEKILQIMLLLDVHTQKERSNIPDP